MFSDEEFVNHVGDSIPVKCLHRPSSVLEEELTSDRALAGRVGRAPLAVELSFEGKP